MEVPIGVKPSEMMGREWEGLLRIMLGFLRGSESRKA